MIEVSRRAVLRAVAATALIPAAGPPGIVDGRPFMLPREGVFDLGDLPLKSGSILMRARIAYKTHGQLDALRQNVILYPTQFAAQHGDVEWIIGPGRALDSDKYFIIVLDQLGNGLSSSPNNTDPPQDRRRFPTIAIQDDIAAQHRLVTEGFGISRIALVTGYSMGAQQAFQWAVSHPGMVERIAPFCGTAKTSPHNVVFLEGVRAALTADSAWMNGEYDKQPEQGVRAFARVYAGWGFSQAFYREALYRELGLASIEVCLTGVWEKRYLRRDANNLLSMLRTWQLNDVSDTPAFAGSLEHALRMVTAKATVMASQTDLYFTPDDIEAQASYISGARFRTIPSLWGHMAGSGLNPADSAFIEREIASLLASP
jgi:homoserine O-acetyltransferase